MIIRPYYLVVRKKRPGRAFGRIRRNLSYNESIAATLGRRWSITNRALWAALLWKLSTKDSVIRPGPSIMSLRRTIFNVATGKFATEAATGVSIIAYRSKCFQCY